MGLNRFQLRRSVAIQFFLVACAPDDSADEPVVKLRFRRTACTTRHLSKFVDTNWLHLVLAGPSHNVVDDNGTCGRIKSVGERGCADDEVNLTSRVQFLDVVTNSRREVSVVPSDPI